MDLEDSTDYFAARSPPFITNKFRTPSTLSDHCTDTLHLDSDPLISEFKLDVEGSCLSKMMGQMSVEEKENEKHTTDRFIPLRKCVRANSDNFSFMDVENEGSVRGQ
jgi:hypothetical protein